MLNFGLPSVVLRDAWSRVRLEVIQRAVENTILELQVVAERENSAGGSVEIDVERRDVNRVALHVCCSELREEAGLVQASTAAPRDAQGTSLQLRPDYMDLLDRYREVAANSLRQTLGPFPSHVVTA